MNPVYNEPPRPTLAGTTPRRQQVALVLAFLAIILVSLLAFLVLYRQALVGSLVFAAGVAACLAVIAWLFRLRGNLERQLRSLNLELEERVRERTAEVGKARYLLETVVENLPDTVLLKEPRGEAFRYLLVNAAGERLFGRDRGDIIGCTEAELFPMEEAATTAAASRAVATSGEPRSFAERRITTPAGERLVETRMVPIPHASGTSALILSIVRDVTDARAREDQLRLLQRMDAIGRLTGGVAHDFNNLLAIIHGNAELLLDRFDSDPEEQAMLADVIGASARGAELVKRLLAFARMQHLEAAAVDLNARLPNIVSLLQRVLGEDVTVRLELGPALWPAIVDPTQVDDALVNLAVNARDAMPDGGTLTIETCNVTLDGDYAAAHLEVAPGDYVMLAVSDTGTGMAPGVAERAFEPFFTTKAEGQGTGLGLSQIFGWVKQSRGHVKIYSELGHGTTVKLYLPRADSAAADADETPDIATPRGHERILVVEDNAEVRRTVVRQLSDLGYRAVEANSGAAALELVRDGLPFDLLLTDVVMPGGLTGTALAARVAAERPDAKILFTSGYTRLAAGETGDHALLSKPYRKQDLAQAVRAALDE